MTEISVGEFKTKEADNLFHSIINDMERAGKSVEYFVENMPFIEMYVNCVYDSNNPKKGTLEHFEKWIEM